MITTLTEHLRDAFTKFAERTAVVDDAGTITYAQLSRLADGMAEALLERGVRAGDRVAVLLPNTRLSVTTYLAIWKIGAVTLPTNPGLTAFELGYIFEHSKPSAVIATGSALANVRTAIEQSGCPVRAVFSDVPLPDAEHVGGLPPATREHWDVGFTTEVVAIMYTSGTSGRPKGVLVPHVGVALSTTAWRNRLHLTADDVVLAVLPFFHVYANVLLLQCTLLTGAKLVPLAGFVFPDILRVLANHRVTFFAAVPPMLLALAERTWAPEKYDLSALRLLVSGGAPLPHETLQRVKDKLGVPMYDGYGCTETSPLVSMGPITAPHRPGSCGRPIEGVTVQICDENGTPVAAGEQGEIRVHTPGLMKGYYNDPVATEQAIVDGWYRTGDVGYLDADGYLYLTDRLKDVLFVAGMNVYPREIEEAIHEFPAVARAAVVRMSFKATGEAPLAYIVPLEGRTVDTVELLAFLRGRLASHKIPKLIEIVTELPTTASGKVLKYKLGTEPR